MADSILVTVKNSLGIPSGTEAFDDTLIMEINAALSTLRELGVGEGDLIIANDEDEWADFLGDATNLEDAKLYICRKVRLSFDPPQNSFLVSAIEKQIEELTWRLMIKTDPALEEEEEEDDA